MYYQNWLAHKKGVMWNMNCAYLGEMFDNIVKIWVDVGKLNFPLNLRRWLSFTKGIVKIKLQ
jgi:hypothetical protein